MREDSALKANVKETRVEKTSKEDPELEELRNRCYEDLMEIRQLLSEQFVINVNAIMTVEVKL